MASEVTSTPTAETLVKKLNLAPHPEGGFYSRTYQSRLSVFFGEKQSTKRAASTAIYYLLDKDNFSAFHRIKSDEIWHHYDGSPLVIHMIDAAGNYLKKILGHPINTENAEFQITVPATVWFAAELIHPSSHALVGCTVSPGFEFRDFELAERSALVKQFPEQQALITRLTRLSGVESSLSLSGSSI